MRMMGLQLTIALSVLGSAIAHDGKSQELLDRKISLQVKERTIGTVFRMLEQMAPVKFVYSSPPIQVERKVSLSVSKQPLAKVLDQLLTPLNLGYELSDELIILHQLAAPSPSSLLLEEPTVDDPAASATAQEITGTVTGSDKQPITGASILVKGTTQGATTDRNGHYQLSVPDGSAVLVFSFIGYLTEEVVVGNRTVIDISLVTDIKSLEEVVVVGYGTVKKSDLTGAVSSVTSKDFGDRVSGSVASLLQGRVAGLDVVGDEIRIRGVSSFYGTQPLVVIDGLLGGNLSTVNANDIERIEVLKDASATAIYGVQGGNGVILVTTKSGKPGPVRVSLNAFGGFQNPIKKLDVLNARQYVELVKEMYTNNGQAGDLSAKILSDDVLIDRTNWQDATQRTGTYQEYNVNFSGGSDKSNYFVSLLYKRNTPVQAGNAVNQNIGLRAKNNFDIRKWFRLGTNLSVNYGTNTGRSVGTGQQRISYPPYYSPYDPTNEWGTTNVNRSEDLTDQYNPINGKLGDGGSRNFDYQVNLFAELEPLKGLVYRAQAGVSGYFGTGWGYNPRTIDGGVQVNRSSTDQFANYSFAPLLENYLTYTKSLGANDFSVLVGTTVQDAYEERKTSVSGQDFIGERYDVININNTAIQIPGQQVYNKYAFFSYFGRLNYTLLNRYLLTANFRANTSPNFAPTNRWGYFPSVAVAWKLHEEAFLQGRIRQLSQLKLRASYGLTGNDNTNGSFRYRSLVWNNTYWPSGQNSTVLNKGATVYSNSSAKIKWESLESTNIGVDVGLFNDQLSFSADYFDRNTNDILVDAPQPISLGYGGNQAGGNATVNAASVKNRGWEFLVNHQNRIGGFSYSVAANLTLVKNKVISLGTGEPYVRDVSRTNTGNPIGYFYGYIADGIYRTQAEIDAANADAQEKGFEYFQDKPTSAGDVRFRDLNGDGRITVDDRTNIGNPIPTHTYGANLNLGFKGFDLNVVWQGVGGNQVYYANYNAIRGMTLVQNAETYVLNRWRSENEPGNGTVPRAVFTDPANNNRMSTLKVEDGAYLRLKQLSLGYSVPAVFLSKVGLQDIEALRFYASSYNLLTFTRFTGYDPELGGDNLQRGYASGGFPSNRQVVFGIRLDF